LWEVPTVQIIILADDQAVMKIHKMFVERVFAELQKIEGKY
jgi:hypothetical protein